MEKVIGEIIEHGPIDIASHATSKATKKEWLIKIGIISVAVIIGGLIIHRITRPNKDDAPATNSGPKQQPMPSLGLPSTA